MLAMGRFVWKQHRYSTQTWEVGTLSLHSSSDADEILCMLPPNTDFVECHVLMIHKTWNMTPELCRKCYRTRVKSTGWQI